MDERDQRVIGFAVGQRGGPGGTGNVFREGVREAVDTMNTEAWPVAYREAVAEGLFIDRNGYISITPSRVQVALELLRPLPDHGTAALDAILIRLKDAQPAAFPTDEDRREVIEALLEAAKTASDSLAELLGQFGAMLSGDV